MTYTKRVERQDGFQDVVDETIEALSAEGFGVLTDVDVQATMAEKLDEDIPPYRVLGACDPATAYDAIGEEPEIGALLPCNVAVRETEDDTVVISAVDPSALLALPENPALDSIIEDVDARIDRVLQQLET